MGSMRREAARPRQGHGRWAGWALVLCALAGCSAAEPSKRPAARAAPEAAPALAVDPNLPCWVDAPNCGGGSSALYFVGTVTLGPPPGLTQDLRRKAATSLALSRYSFNLRTRVSSEDTVRQSCSRMGRQVEQCVQDYESQLSLDTQSLVNSGDFEVVDEYVSGVQGRYYLRIAVPLSTFRSRVAEVIKFASSQ